VYAGLPLVRTLALPVTDVGFKQARWFFERERKVCHVVRASPVTMSVLVANCYLAVFITYGNQSAEITCIGW
jgi:hypothetical protein